MRYGDLADVAIRPQRKLSPDELALADGIIIRPDDFFAGRLDEASYEKVLENEESMASLAQAEMSNGGAIRMTNWLAKQDKKQKILQVAPNPSLGNDETAMVTLTRLLKGMALGKPDADDRAALKQIHDATRKKFLDVIKQQKELKAKIDRHARSRASATKHIAGMRRSKRQYESGESRIATPSSTSISRRSIHTGNIDYGYSEHNVESESESSSDNSERSDDSERSAKRVKVEHVTMAAATPTVHIPSETDTFIPGFKNDEVSTFICQCTICERTALLALVLEVHEVLVAPKPENWSQFLADIEPEQLFWPKVCCMPVPAISSTQMSFSLRSQSLAHFLSCRSTTTWMPGSRL